jgi:hypothetical protein
MEVHTGEERAADDAAPALETVRISKHGIKQTRKRCGVPKKATVRMAQLAYERGLRLDEMKGMVRRWSEWTMHKHGDDREVRLYGADLFLFGENKQLITVIKVPESVRKSALAQKKKEE